MARLRPASGSTASGGLAPAAGTPVQITSALMTSNRTAGSPLSVLTGVWENVLYFTYQWERSDALAGGPYGDTDGTYGDGTYGDGTYGAAGTVTGDTYSDIPGAVSASYVPTDADVGYLLQVVITAHNPPAADVSVTVPAGGAIVAAPTPPPPPPPPTGEEEKATGRTATASSTKPTNATGVFTPDKAVDGDPVTRFSTVFGLDDEWWQVDLGSARWVSRVEIDWHLSYADTFVLQTSLNGSTWTDQVAVDYANDAGPANPYIIQFKDASGLPENRSARYVRLHLLTRSLYSVTNGYGFSFYDVRVFGVVDSSPPSTLPPANTLRPALTGPAQVGQQASCSTGTWDGRVPVAGSGLTVAYQWTANTNDIPGATASVYTPTTIYLGQVLGCRVTATDTGGSASVLATGGGTIQPAGTTPPPAEAPVFTTLPVLSGTPTTGLTVTSSTGQASGSPTYAYQWQREGATNVWADIAGAAGGTYTALAVGDSITAGVGSRWNGSITTALAANGIQTAFPTYLDPTEQDAGLGARIGRAGWCTTDVGGVCINGPTTQGVLDFMPSWLASTNPRIVAIHVGTNDIDAGSFSGDRSDAGIAGRIGQIVDAAIAFNPQMVVVVDKIKFNGNSFTTLNAAIQSAVNARASAGKNVRLIDSYTGFVSPTDWNVDTFHPSSSGYDKMATQWAAGITTGVQASSTPPLNHLMVTADEGHRLRMRAIATNSAGSVTGYSSNTLTGVAPVVSSGTLRTLLTDDITKSSEVIPEFDYDWSYNPRSHWPPPSRMTACVAWGVIANARGGNPQPNAKVHILSIETWFKLKSTNAWTRTQLKTDFLKAEGGAYYANSYNNSNMSAGQIAGPGGVGTVVKAPPPGYNFHYYPPRQNQTPSNLAAQITVIRAQLLAGSWTGTLPNLTMVAALDWWLNMDAQWEPTYYNNFDGGIGRFKRIETTPRMWTCAIGDLSTLPPITYSTAEMH